MIGDYVIITPAIRALREAFPHAHLSIFIKENTKELVETNPDVNEIIIDPDEIKIRKFDLAIDFYGDPKYARLLKKARIPYRIGDASKLINNLYYNIRVFINWRDFTKHYLEHYLELLKPLGINVTDPAINIQPTEKALANVNQTLLATTQSDLIGLHVGTGGGNRSWTAENFAKLSDLIMEQLGQQVILLGGPKETSKAVEIIEHCKIKPLNLVGKISLTELVAVISLLKAYIGTDTGPFHIAAGLKIPVVGLMPTKFVKPTQWGPWGTRNIILRPTSPCDKACNPRVCTDNACLDKISPAEVLETLKTILAGGGNKNLAESKKDWIKKSLNILLVNAVEVKKSLQNQDYRVFTLNNPSLRELLEIFIKEDINILHTTKPGLNLKLRFACLLSSLKSLLPVLFVQTKQKLATADEIIGQCLQKLENKYH